LGKTLFKGFSPTAAGGHAAFIFFFSLPFHMSAAERRRERARFAARIETF